MATKTCEQRQLKALGSCQVSGSALNRHGGTGRLAAGRILCDVP